MSAMPKTGNEQKTVKPKVRKILDKYGWFWWATPMNGYGRTGISDTIAMKAGITMAIESKFGGRRCTAQQIGFLNSISEQPAAFGLVVNEKNFDVFAKFVAAFEVATALTAQKKGVPADTGAPMLDTLKILTDYPRSMEDFTRWKADPTSFGRNHLDDEEPITFKGDSYDDDGSD